MELNKNKKDPIYDEDLNEITSLYLNKLDLIGEPTDITIYDLIFFKNLKECTISNMNISDKELAILNRLSNLESLQLNDCNFSNKTKVELNIKNLIINDCENVNNAITDILDKDDYIKEQYFLEVSSTGVEKMIRKDKHLKENIGEYITIKLFKPINNFKEYVGKLKSFDDQIITIEVENEELNIERKNISLIKKYYDWNV